MTTPLTTESRTALASALGSIGVRVHTVAPQVPKPPCIVIVPDSPWVTPDRIGSNLNYQVRWRVLAVVSLRSNEAAQQDAETITDKVLKALPAGYTPSQVGAPAITDTGAQGSVITIEIAVSAHMKE